MNQSDQYTNLLTCSTVWQMLTNKLNY